MITCLEFFSGIGGLVIRFYTPLLSDMSGLLTIYSKHHALNVGGIDAMVVKAFDMNEVANKVYQHSFGSTPSNVGIVCYLQLC